MSFTTSTCSFPNSRVGETSSASHDQKLAVSAERAWISVGRTEAGPEPGCDARSALPYCVETVAIGAKRCWVSSASWHLQPDLPKQGSKALHSCQGARRPGAANSEQRTSLVHPLHDSTCPDHGQRADPTGRARRGLVRTASRSPNTNGQRE